MTINNNKEEKNITTKYMELKKEYPQIDLHDSYGQRFIVYQYIGENFIICEYNGNYYDVLEKRIKMFSKAKEHFENKTEVYYKAIKAIKENLFSIKMSHDTWFYLVSICLVNSFNEAREKNEDKQNRR